MRYGIHLSGRAAWAIAFTIVFAVVIMFTFWPKVEYGDDTINIEPATEESVSTTTPSATPVLPSVVMSAPTAIYMPGDNKTRIRTEPVALECGIKDIPYPETGPDFWRSFYCTDRALPGTDMPYYGIITGHSSWSEDTVMGRLLLRKDSLKGERIYVRTEASGKEWLVFTFTDIEVVEKDRLQGAKAWGDEHSSTANQLVWLTCGQKRYGYSRTVNVLMIAKFTGVIDTPPM